MKTKQNMNNIDGLLVSYRLHGT